MMNTKGRHGWSRVHLCTLTHCWNSCLLSPRSSRLKEHFRELRHPSIWRANIDFQVTGRRMEERADEEAKYREMRCVFFALYYYFLFFCFFFLNGSWSTAFRHINSNYRIREAIRMVKCSPADICSRHDVSARHCTHPHCDGLRLKHGQLHPVKIKMKREFKCSRP